MIKHPRYFETEEQVWKHLETRGFIDCEGLFDMYRPSDDLLASTLHCNRGFYIIMSLTDGADKWA